MEQKMVQGAGLSLRQKQFLDVVLHTKEVLKQFYLSGGTALSSWYLHHRESYDLDFFSDRPFNGEKLAYWIKQQRDALEYQSLVVNDDFGFYTFVFRYKDNSRFTVDFCNYAAHRLMKGFTWRGLQIDSMYDIAVNKIQAIRINPRERDYVDLYCVLKKTQWDIHTLLTDADKKFNITTDILQVAQQFLKVAEISGYPTMLIPFDKKGMENFFLKLAKDLEKEIFL